MRRRTFLAAATAFTGTTAGCLGAAASVFPDSAGEDARPERVLSTCPSFGYGDGRAVCVGDDAGGPVTVTRNTAVVSRGDLVVTLTNAAADAVGVNSYAWTVFRRDGDDWTQVAPDAYVRPRRTLDRGESLSWHLMVGRSRETPEDGDVYVEPLGLDDGVYAFVVVAVLDGERREFVAPFEVE